MPGQERTDPGMRPLLKKTEKMELTVPSEVVYTRVCVLECVVTFGILCCMQGGPRFNC